MKLFDFFTLVGFAGFACLLYAIMTYTGRITRALESIVNLAEKTED